MLNWWEQLILGAVVGVLHGLKLDPSKSKAAKSLLVAILTAVCELLGVAPPEVPE